MPDKMTIDDIAEALGVSKTTVSRAISGKGRISAATTARIRDYIEQHNYKPNVVARGLAQQRTYNIGVVCPLDYEIFDLPFFHRCLHGISEVTAAAGYDILLSMLEAQGHRNLQRIVEHRKVDGVVLTRTLLHDPVAEYLKRSGLPFVVIGSSPDPELVQIDNDHRNACCELTSILLGKGMRKLALVGKDDHQIITETRRKGFEAAFVRAGLTADPALIYLRADNEHAVLTILEDALARGAEGIVCMDERIATMMLAACREKGVRVPEDVRLASFYNSQALDHSSPAITAVDVDDRKIGFTAARTLLELIEGREPGSQFLKNYKIILRESTM